MVISRENRRNLEKILLQHHFAYQMNLLHSKVTRDYAEISRASRQRLTICTVRNVGLF
jgi:hypothetical protein